MPDRQDDCLYMEGAEPDREKTAARDTIVQTERIDLLCLDKARPRTRGEQLRGEKDG